MMQLDSMKPGGLCVTLFVQKVRLMLFLFTTLFVQTMFLYSAGLKRCRECISCCRCLQEPVFGCINSIQPKDIAQVRHSLVCLGLHCLLASDVCRKWIHIAVECQRVMESGGGACRRQD